MEELFVILFDENYATGFVVEFEDLRLVDPLLCQVSFHVQDALLLLKALERSLNLGACH